MPRGATLKDLATKLDISVATVSRALAGHERISPHTRDRVTQAAREIGYVPNQAARALVSGRSGFVGLVLSVRSFGVADPFLGEFLTGLGNGLARHGTDIFLVTVPEGKTELSVIKGIVQANRADGLVLARTSEHDERVAYLLEHGFPFVSHGRILDDKVPYRWLDTDGTAAFEHAFDLLYELGHRKFGLMEIAEPMTFRRLRAAGLTRGRDRRNDPEVEIFKVCSPRFDRDARTQVIREMLLRPDRPTAILGLFDGLALNVMEEAARLGLRIPDDISVVGFDNIPAAEHRQPGLTTFDTEISDSADQIADMLVRAMSKDPGPVETRLIKPRMILRGSHGPAPPRSN